MARALHGLSVSELDDNEEGIIKPLQIFGLGLWHPKDTKILASLFSNNTVSNQTPLTLSGMVLESDYSNGKKLLCGMPLSRGTCRNLDSEKKRLCDDTLDSCYYLRSIYSHNSLPCFGTTRVVRLFKTSAGGVPEQLNRIDWQTPYQFSPCNEEINRIKDEVLWDTKFSAIVVHDFNKGSICLELIRILIEKYPAAKWFVRTKKPNVSWLNLIPEDKLRLLLIGADYVPRRSKTKRWFYGNEASKEACEELKKLARFDQINISNTERQIIAIHEDNSMLALSSIGKGEEINGISITSTMSPQPINIGRSSIMFSSCIASLLGCYGNNSEKAMLIRANGHANKWTISYTDRIRNTHFHEKTVPVYPLWGDFSQAIKTDEYPDDIPKPCAKSFSCNTLLESWQNQSFQDIGIVTERDRVTCKDKRIFYLWRGYSCIGNYVAIRRDLRIKLNDLYQSIHNFKCDSKTSSLNCLIQGAPGWGKTFLSEKLAESFDLNPLFFNVAQLTSLDQVIDCFDSISSLQNQQKNKPVLAFFDEIDSPIDSQYTFPLFLAPILDGTYRRGGRVFHLLPCVWVFAGATSLLELPKAQKTKDFMSRINGPIIKLDFGENLDAEALTEQVYIGVSILQQIFNDVSKVSENVLRFFHSLKLRHGIRSLQQAIRKFRNIQYGEVRQSNLPKYEEIKLLIEINKDTYENLREKKEIEDLIEIRKEPS
ncbi:MAG: AAA family ATPase [Candidatus Cloacimonetes bacterium]|nr:AAA family ATPase [Candidatus Cloacimonadota bacterium]